MYLINLMKCNFLTFQVIVRGNLKIVLPLPDNCLNYFLEISQKSGFSKSEIELQGPNLTILAYRRLQMRRFV